jgi:hypothetical protein
MKTGKTETIERIKETLAAQAELMLEFGACEQELQQAVLARDWPAMDALVSRMEGPSGELAALDARRHELFLKAKSEVGADASSTFAEFVERIPDADRRELTRLFRSLQVSVLRVKSVTRGIDSYVRGSLKTTNEVLGTVFPDQKGTFYSRHGRRSPADGRAMVLDRRL